MSAVRILSCIVFISAMLSSCQAIGDIFSAGVWVGVILVVVVIIILFAVFRKRS